MYQKNLNQISVSKIEYSKRDEHKNTERVKKHIVITTNIKGVQNYSIRIIRFGISGIPFQKPDNSNQVSDF